MSSKLTSLKNQGLNLLSVTSTTTPCATSEVGDRAVAITGGWKDMLRLRHPHVRTAIDNLVVGGFRWTEIGYANQINRLSGSIPIAS